MRRAYRDNTWIYVLSILAVSILSSFVIAFAIHKLTDTHPGQVKALAMSDATFVEVVDDSIVAYNGSEINCYASNGKARWKKSLPVGNGYKLSVASNAIAAWKENSFSIWNTSDGGSLFSGTMDSNIVSVRMGSKYFAVLYGDADRSTVRVMDTSGRIYDDIEFDSKVVLNYGFYSADEAMMWALSVDTSGTVPTCTLSTYRPNRKAMSGAIDESEQVVYHVAFEKNTIRMVGTDFIKRYDYTGSEYKDMRTLVYGWYLVDATDTSDSPLMVFAPNQQVSGTMSVSDVRMICGSVDKIVRMPFACKNLIVRGKRLYGFSSDCVMRADVGQTNIEAYKLNMSIDDVAGVTSDNVGVIYANGLYYLVTLP